MEEVKKEKLICSDCGKEIEDNNFYTLDNGDIICQECFEDNYFICEDCGSIVHLDYYYYTSDDKRICESCYENNYFTCTGCGEIHPRSEEIYTADTEESYCLNCADNGLIHQCDDCGEWYADEGHFQILNNGDWICDNCLYDSGYGCCESCGEWDYSDNLCWSDEDNCYYCNDCYEEYENENLIKSYHAHKHDFIKKATEKDKAKTPLYFGVELEVENKQNNIENNEMARKIDDIMQGLVVFENDGSLNNGFENITQPMTFNFIKQNKEKFEKMLAELVKNGFISHDATTCGFHIHLSRNYFTNNEIDKLQFIIEKFKKELLIFSRRDRSEARHWAKFLSDEAPQNESLNTKYIKKYKNTYDRYFALNRSNNSTIEFRLLRGTLKATTFFAGIELLNNLSKIAKYKSEKYIEKMTFKDIVYYGKNNKNLKAYCIEKNLTESEVQ